MWHNSPTSFGTVERWSAHLEILIETEEYSYYLERAVIEGSYGALLVVRRCNGATSFGNVFSWAINMFANEEIERKITAQDYLEIDVRHDTEVEKDCS